MAASEDQSLRIYQKSYSVFSTFAFFESSVCNLDSMLSTDVSFMQIPMFLEHLSMYLRLIQLYDELDKAFAVYLVVFLAVEKREYDENYNSDFKVLLRRHQVNFLFSGQDSAKIGSVARRKQDRSLGENKSNII